MNKLKDLQYIAVCDEVFFHGHNTKSIVFGHTHT